MSLVFINISVPLAQKCDLLWRQLSNKEKYDTIFKEEKSYDTLVVVQMFFELSPLSIKKKNEKYDTIFKEEKKL
jgi:hypothetical protein